MKAFVQHKAENGGKMVLQALVSFPELDKSAVFTCRANPSARSDDKEMIAKTSYDYYQRRIDVSRLREIEHFILDSILDERDNVLLATLFPSSMIIAVNSDENEIERIDGECGEVKIDIVKNVFIVDGQHRLMAMKKVYEKITHDRTFLGDDTNYVKEYIENYKFNCIILVDYDLWEQGQVFINVNFKQKPVNKSLYYEVFGSEYRDNKNDLKRNKIYLAHCLAKVLNEDKLSPYYHRVKMLGTGDGYISQAFVVEALLPHFNTGGIWDCDSNGKISGNNDIHYFATELLSFYASIKKMFIRYWAADDDYKKGTIVCKSTGFAAFCQIMKIVRTAGDEEMIGALKWSEERQELCELYMDRVEEMLSPLKERAEELFGTKSVYNSKSGKGAQTTLRNQLLSILGLEKSILKVRADWSGRINLEKVVENVYNYVQNYVYSQYLNDIDPLCNHYEAMDISNLLFTRIESVGNLFRINCKLDLDVQLYLDSTNEANFSMNFPCECVAILSSVDLEVKVVEDFRVDVTKYYQ